MIIAKFGRPAYKHAGIPLTMPLRSGVYMLLLMFIEVTNVSIYFHYPTR